MHLADARIIMSQPGHKPEHSYFLEMYVLCRRMKNAGYETAKTVAMDTIQRHLPVVVK